MAYEDPAPVTPPSPPPAPGEEDSIALALVNTALEPRGGPLELLPDGRALAEWLATHRDRSTGSARLGGEAVAQIHALRAAIRAAFTARARGQRPPWPALTAINASASLAGRTFRLCWGSDGPRAETVWDPAASAAEVALAELANDAILTLGSPIGVRIRLCEAPGCTRLFITDPHRRRRWCSDACGDRARVARHYHRHRARG